MSFESLGREELVEELMRVEVLVAAGGRVLNDRTTRLETSMIALRPIGALSFLLLSGIPHLLSLPSSTPLRPFPTILLRLILLVHFILNNKHYYIPSQKNFQSISCPSTFHTNQKNTTTTNNTSSNSSSSSRPFARTRKS